MTFQSAFFDELRKIAATFNGIEFDHAMNMRDHGPILAHQTDVNIARENPDPYVRDSAYGRDLLYHPKAGKRLGYFIDRAQRRTERLADAWGMPAPQSRQEADARLLAMFNEAADSRKEGFSLLPNADLSSPRSLFRLKTPPQPRSVVVRPTYDRDPTSPDPSKYIKYNREQTRNSIAHEAFHANNPRLGGSELLAHIYGGYKAPLPGSSIFKRLRGGIAGAKDYWRRVDNDEYPQVVQTPQGPKVTKRRKYW